MTAVHWRVDSSDLLLDLVLGSPATIDVAIRPNGTEYFSIKGNCVIEVARIQPADPLGANEGLAAV